MPNLQSTLNFSALFCKNILKPETSPKCNNDNFIVPSYNMGIL